MGPAGSVSGPQYFASDSVGQTIPAGPGASGTLNSTLTVPSFNGTFQIARLTVQLNAAFPVDSALGATLIAPDGTQIPLFSGVGGNGSNFINTVLDDTALNPITAGTAPFTGTFQPSGKLANLAGHSVDFKNAAGNWVPGVWTLRLVNSQSGITGTLGSWSLNITPVVSVTPVSPANGLATTFTVGFPQQQLSGTYTIQLGTGILDQLGQAPDTNQNAGLDILRGQSQNGPTTPVQYQAADLPQPIPAPTSSSSPGQVTSTITVPDDFIVQGDTTSSGVSGLRVQINLTYPNDPDLTATLYHYDANGDQLGPAVPLFSNVGHGINTANFTNTVFDDNSATPIQNGSARSSPRSARRARWGSRWPVSRG